MIIERKFKLVKKMLLLNEKENVAIIPFSHDEEKKKTIYNSTDEKYYSFIDNDDFICLAIETDQRVNTLIYKVNEIKNNIANSKLIYMALGDKVVYDKQAIF